MIREVIGYLALFILLICNIPQVIRSFNTKDFKGVSILSILFKLSGFLLLLIYILMDSTVQMPLILNYSLNSLALVIILVIYYRSRK